MKLEKAPIAWKGMLYSYTDEIQRLEKKALDEYLYWDKVKYLNVSKDVDLKALWLLIKESRKLYSIYLKFGHHEFMYCNTPQIQRIFHEFDREYGGRLVANSQLSDSDKQQYLISSVMEEAIASSQIEGALTTRKAAKNMLLENRAPRNKSELMIMNNYITIQRIKELKDQPLTEELLLEIHKLMTAGTLDNANDEGSLRDNDEIQVIDAADNEVVHIPPTHTELPALMGDLYKFFNEEEHAFFIHPVVKACIIHFMIGYIHPFVDGNGRTARALFYWYMLKKGYWLTEYLSISSIILKQKVKYAKAFLYTETDDNDLTYFINYKMDVLESAYKSLMDYINRKLKEKKAAAHFLKEGNVNERQALILQWLEEDSDRIIKVKEVQNYFAISNQTARGDLQDLVKQGYLEEKGVNQKQKIYLKSAKK